MAICAAAPLPQTGEHYFEVSFRLPSFRDPTREKDLDGAYQRNAAVGLWCAPKLGIDNNTLAQLLTKHGKPFWGLRGDKDNDALRVRGKAFGKVGLNSSGWAISNGDTVGVLVNMDNPSMTFFRDGQPIPNAIIRLSYTDGFKKTDARIAVCCVTGSVTLTHKRREDGQDQVSATL